MTLLQIAMMAMLSVNPHAAEAQDMTLDLMMAKQQGLVGERPNGLIGAVNPEADPEVRALVETLNTIRLERYNEISGKQGASVKDVQNIAGETLIKMTPAGQYVMTEDGRWVQK